MINIYVGNLPFKTTESDLQALFSPYGTIEKTSIIADRETGRSRGFGFVEMSNPEEGKAAIEAFNGKDYEGRALTVNEAKPRPANSMSARGSRTGGGSNTGSVGYGNSSVGR